MPRNGSGTYNLPAGNPVVPGTVISSSGWANPTLNDIAAALTGSWALNGEGIPTANQSLGNFRLTNVGNAINRNEYAAYGQVQDGQPQWMTVTGTDTILGTIAPGPTGYVAGQAFRFVAGGNNTGAVTLNINSLGAKAITKNGTNPLVAGDILSGSVVNVVYDGTQFQLAAVSLGRLIAVQVFTASGTWTKPAGCNSVYVEVIGGGGAGGGAPATGGAPNGSCGGGGGSGGYSSAYVTSGLGATVAVTVGNGGTGVAGATGGNGGVSSFGTFAVANGGTGGLIASGAGVHFAAGGTGGSASAGSANFVGQAGGVGTGDPVSGTTLSGNGGPSAFSGGGRWVGPSSNGSAPTTQGGGGGSGAANGAGQPALTGGAGAAGLVIVRSFS